MSEACELLAELQATVGLARADRRADAWRWLDDIDRLASRLEAVLPMSTADLVDAAIAPGLLDAAKRDHSWVVLGLGVIGYRAVCPCGWETDRYPDRRTAAEAGREHGPSSALTKAGG